MEGAVMMIILVHIVDDVFTTHLAISVHTDQNGSLLCMLVSDARLGRDTSTMSTLRNVYNEPGASKLAQTEGRMRHLK